MQGEGLLLLGAHRDEDVPGTSPHLLKNVFFRYMLSDVDAVSSDGHLCVYLGAASSARLSRTSDKSTLSVLTKLLLSERRARRLARSLLIVAAVTATAHGGARGAVCHPCV